MVKTRVCGKCNKVLASPQSLWNHKQRCKSAAAAETSSVTPTIKFLSTPTVKKVVDKDIQALLNKIVGDSSPVKQRVFDITPAKRFKADFGEVAAASSPPVKRRLFAPPPVNIVEAVFEPVPIVEVIPDYEDYEDEDEVLLPVPSRNVVEAAVVTFPRPESDESDIEVDIEEEAEPRTKNDIVGYTLDDLYNRFKELWSHCVDNKHGASKSELKCLIEELFNRDAMSDDMYTKSKKIIDKVHGDGVGDVDMVYDGDINKLIQRTFSDIIQHDKNELKAIIKECLLTYKDNDDTVNILGDLTKALQIFYKEKIVNNKPVIDTVLCIIGKLDQVSKLKKLKLKMLVKEIDRNRHRVGKVLHALHDVHDKKEAG